MRHPFILKGPFFPSVKQYKLGASLDLEKSRESFLADRFTNLDFLLKSRYEWMNKHIQPHHKGVELGCGLGVSRLYIKNENLSLTDIIPNPWVDEVVDALNMPYAESSLDYIIALNMIHHVSNPMQFFKECSRVLKPKGILLIHEPNLSLSFRIILRLMAHEGYDFSADIFSPHSSISDPKNPWTANNAVANLLFDDPEKFEANSSFKLKIKQLCECFIFPLSGGVSYRTFSIPLPIIVLKGIDIIDRILIRMAPSVFAMGLRVVLVNAKGE